MELLGWFKRWCWEERRSARYANPGLVAYFWEGGAPREHPLKDISLTGAYIFAKDLWLVGTVLDITLQTTSDGKNPSELPFWSVHGKVVRHGADGFGVDFMWREDEDRKAFKGLLRSLAQRADAPGRRRSGAGRPGSDGSDSRRSGSQGQALVEYALVVPILFYLILNTVSFGSFIYSWITVANAARAAGQYAAMGAAYASYPTPATLNGVKAVIQNETSSLLNASATNPAVEICENLNGTAVAYPPTGSPPAACTGTAPPLDPETITGAVGASHYTSVAIDVTYDVTPIVSAFNFPGLNLLMVSLPSSIHRRTVMRVLN
jgi:Flp pilus assembly protein TadG